MPTIHTVEQGECLSSIAYHYKLASWQVIYDDSHNAEFREKRPNPNLIYPGDELYIPDVEPRSEDVPADSRHIFVVSFPPTYVNIRVQDLDDQPIGGAQYELKLDAVTLTGTTDDDGWIRSKIPAWAELGTLKVWPNPDDQETVIEWGAKLGHLDPLDADQRSQRAAEQLGLRLRRGQRRRG